MNDAHTGEGETISTLSVHDELMHRYRTTGVQPKAASVLREEGVESLPLDDDDYSYHFTLVTALTWAVAHLDELDASPSDWTDRLQVMLTTALELLVRLGAETNGEPERWEGATMEHEEANQGPL